MAKEVAPKKKAVLNLQVDPGIYEELKALAEADKRSLANYVRVILEEEVARHREKK